MKFKTVLFPMDGSEPTETVHNTLTDVATAITDNPQWETEARGFYIDWIDDGQDQP